MKDTFKIGDTVMWRGAFGTDAAKPAVIESIDRTERPHTKYGEPVEEMAWQDRNYCLVTLDNGHWAYGSQLSPL